MGAPTGYAAPMMSAEPPEASSIKSMLHIARIIALIFGILILLAGLLFVAVLAVIGFGGFAIFGGLWIIWAIVDFVIYVQLKEIEAMVNQRKYEAAKSKTLVWMIIGFILGGIIIGILILIAWIKFDPLITWQRNQMQGAAAPRPTLRRPRWRLPPRRRLRPPLPGPLRRPSVRSAASPPRTSRSTGGTTATRTTCTCNAVPRRGT